MNQRYQQLDSKAIEALKVARNQVIQAEKNRGENTNANKEPNPSPKQAPHNKFAEEFIQKLASIGREKVAVDEEIAKMEKIWLSLTEKKKQLEDRRDELIKVRDKLKELDKEMSDVLKSQLV